MRGKEGFSIFFENAHWNFLFFALSLVFGFEKNDDSVFQGNLKNAQDLGKIDPKLAIWPAGIGGQLFFRHFFQRIIKEKYGEKNLLFVLPNHLMTSSPDN